MEERGILFNGEMVRAIIDGRKTQTRRVVKPQPPLRWSKVRWIDLLRCAWAYMWPNADKHVVKCPYGQPGDRLWVRETCRAEELESGLDGVRYRADMAFVEIENSQLASERWCSLAREVGADVLKWRPSIHMPRWASRITLEVVSVRVERVQEITPEDAEAEGIALTAKEQASTNSASKFCPKFRFLWDSINVKRGYGWAVNPWVWVVEFKRVDA